MTRNLDKRVEVGFPLLTDSHKKFVIEFLELQLADTVKGRILNHKLKNRYAEAEEAIESQEEIRKLIEQFEL